MNIEFITKTYTLKKVFAVIDKGYYDIEELRSICRYIIETGHAIVDDPQLRESLIKMDVIAEEEGNNDPWPMFVAGKNFAKFSDEVEEKYWEK